MSELRWRVCREIPTRRVCAASRSLESLLVGIGHDVVSAVAIDPRADDDVLLALALAEGRALVTVDKDFGELIFVLRQPHGTIIRFAEMSVDDQVAAMQELLDRHKSESSQPRLPWLISI